MANDEICAHTTAEDTKDLARKLSDAIALKDDAFDNPAS